MQPTNSPEVTKIITAILPGGQVAEIDPSNYHISERDGQVYAFPKAKIKRYEAPAPTIGSSTSGFALGVREVIEKTLNPSDIGGYAVSKRVEGIE